MPYSRAIPLIVSNRRDFSVYVYGLFVIAILSALMSPFPLPMVFLSSLLFGIGQFLIKLGFCKINDAKLISVIFPTGQLTIESNVEHKIEGFLSGQQWCTHVVTVLQYKTDGEIKRVVIMSRQQNADAYRRLRVCLQQDFCNDTSKCDVSGVWPARRA